MMTFSADCTISGVAPTEAPARAETATVSNSRASHYKRTMRTGHDATILGDGGGLDDGPIKLALLAVLLVLPVKIAVT
jgi:hypothetical protein